MRKLLTDCEKATQGTIFSNVQCNEYEEPVYGIFIAARCDMENAHFSSYAYLPVVPLDLWEKKSLIYLICKACKKDAEKTIKEKFERHKLSLDALYYLQTYDKLLTDNFQKKEKAELEKKIKLLLAYKKIQSGDSLDEKAIEFILENFNKTAKEIKKSLINNELSGFFYLEYIDITDQIKQKCTHYIVLLNEVHSLPDEIVKKMTYGIDLRRDKKYRKFFSKENEVMICSTLTSPYIEGLIQMFTSLFRVGIERAQPI